MTAFATSIGEQDGVLSGPLRTPQQMLAVQEYDGHTSIHDDATAQKLGFKGGTIEGPTHFSQFAPLAVAAFGDHFLSHGCLSAHYRSPVYEGEQVRAFLRRPLHGTRAEIYMLRGDGTEILRGTAALGPRFPPSALEERLKELKPLAQPVVLAEVRVGMRSGRSPVRMGFDQPMGALYPFTLRQKLGRITEPSSYFLTGGNPWSRPIVPFEMISVLMQYTAGDDGFNVKGPAVGLFADQEIRLHEGPVFVDEEYQIEREIIALSGSRRTESMWVRSTLYGAGGEKTVATMLLNLATLTETYAPYARERAELYGARDP